MCVFLCVCKTLETLQWTGCMACCFVMGRVTCKYTSQCTFLFAFSFFRSASSNCVLCVVCLWESVVCLWDSKDANDNLKWSGMMTSWTECVLSALHGCVRVCVCTILCGAQHQTKGCQLGLLIAQEHSHVWMWNEHLRDNGRSSMWYFPGWIEGKVT